jgi:hypothetical protein
MQIIHKIDEFLFTIFPELIGGGIMFMVDALQFFDNKPTAEIKKIALEIAMQGTQGISPDKDNYRINSIKNKTFSGYHMLAYYYVSWALAMPLEINKLGLDYKNEFEMALLMNKQKN